jgi:hypothetical protein
MKKVYVFICFSVLQLFIPGIGTSVTKDATNKVNDSVIRIGTKHFPTVKGDEKSIVSADINCDGRTDFAILGYEKNVLYVMLVRGELSETSKVDTLAIGLGNPSSQNHLCGKKAKLNLESQEYDLTEELGENPEGFKKSKICKGLNVSDGMCDSFHIYWNHKTNSLDSWRL